MLKEGVLKPPSPQAPPPPEYATDIDTFLEVLPSGTRLGEFSPFGLLFEGHGDFFWKKISPNNW